MLYFSVIRFLLDSSAIYAELTNIIFHSSLRMDKSCEKCLNLAKPLSALLTNLHKAPSEFKFSSITQVKLHLGNSVVFRKKIVAQCVAVHTHKNGLAMILNKRAVIISLYQMILLIKLYIFQIVLFLTSFIFKNISLQINVQYYFVVILSFR